MTVIIQQTPDGYTKHDTAKQSENEENDQLKDCITYLKNYIIEIKNDNTIKKKDKENEIKFAEANLKFEVLRLKFNIMMKIVKTVPEAYFGINDHINNTRRICGDILDEKHPDKVYKNNKTSKEERDEYIGGYICRLVDFQLNLLSGDGEESDNEE
tara:strand:+ start:144 stop:611 length:468 start_codon:yes stop_codon:yes gene_type:complete